MMVALSFDDCTVVEFRRYRLHHGRLPDLLAIFERHLVEPQEANGMAVGGTFVDEGDPDCFTWLRGFADNDARVRALEGFYGGPVWARYADAANATMMDSDDVLVLRPTQPAHELGVAVRRGGPDDRPRHERVLAGTCGLASAAEPIEVWFASTGVPALEDVLGVRVTAWRTDPTPNGFPRLPVREERVIVWFAVFPDGDTREGAAARLASAKIGRELGERTSWRRTLRLAPTARSAHPASEPPPARDATQPAAE